MGNWLQDLAQFWPLRQKARQYPLLLQFDTNPLVIASGGSGVGTITLPGDCDMQIDDWTYWSSNATANATFPDHSGFRVSIYYGSGDWCLNYPASNGVRGENLFGTAQFPGRIGYRPWALDTYGNRGLLTFNVTNLLSTTLTLEICLRGHRTSRGNG